MTDWYIPVCALSGLLLHMHGRGVTYAHTHTVVLQTFVVGAWVGYRGTPCNWVDGHVDTNSLWLWLPWGRFEPTGACRYNEYVLPYMSWSSFNDRHPSLSSLEEEWCQLLSLGMQSYISRWYEQNTNVTSKSKVCSMHRIRMYLINRDIEMTLH